MNKNYHFETLQLHAGQEKPDSATGARVVPIYQTTSYVFENCADAASQFALETPGSIYSRISNPTVDAFEQRIAALEGGVAAVATASGAAAITYALLNLTQAGDNIVAAATIYGGSYNLLAQTLPPYGITTRFVTEDSPAAFAAAIDNRTRAIFVETIGNPNATLLDLDSLGEIAHKNGIPLVVDNTFATPYLLRPFAHGADVVVHSASKFIGGHGTAIGGVIVDGGSFDWTKSGKFPGLTEPSESYHGLRFSESAGAAAFAARARCIYLRDLGATLAPLHAFLFLQGLESLSLRVERHTENALRVVDFLSTRPEIARINHPAVQSHPHHALYCRYFPHGGISVFTVELRGGEHAARAFIDHLQLFSLLANVADAKSLVIHPASTTHAQLSGQALADAGITPGTVRLSIGTEHVDDLLADLQHALDAIH